MAPICPKGRLARVVAPIGMVIFAEMVWASPNDIDANELRRCRTLSDDSKRLACYDRATAADRALPFNAEPASNGASAATIVVVPSAVGPTSRRAPQDGPAPPTKEIEFGLNRPAPEELAAITSHVKGWFAGWSRGRQIPLVNGQVWEVTDNTVGTYGLQAPLATVRRGMFGSYFLEIEGVGQTPKVRRLK